MKLIFINWVFKYFGKKRKWRKMKTLNKKNFFLLKLLYNNIYKYINFGLIIDKSINIFIKENTNIKVLKFLKFNCYFYCVQLLDLIIIDNLELVKKSSNRYEYVYVLLSIIYNVRIFVRGFIKPFSFINSVISIFSSANWFEREAWDMFGIIFINHIDLRRILTDYGFLGHPFKKDFPLTGYVEVRYDDIQKTIVCEPLELMQEFRYFNLENVWKKL